MISLFCFMMWEETILACEVYGLVNNLCIISVDFMSLRELLELANRLYVSTV